METLQKNKLLVFSSILVPFWVYLMWDKTSALSHNALYHLQIASLYTKGQFDLSVLGVLENSFFSSYFVNQHALYHFFLIPFVTVIEGVRAVSVANGVLMAGMILILAKFLKILGVKNPIFWSMVLPFLQNHGFARLLWGRPGALIIASILCCFLLLWRNPRPFWYFLLALFFVSFSYFALLLIPLILMYGVINFVRDRQNVCWQPLLLYCLGIGFGLFVSLSPLQTFEYFATLISNVVSNDSKIHEWRVPENLLGNHWMYLALMLAGFIQLLRNRSKATLAQTYFGLLSLAFLILLIKSHRFESLFCIFTGIFFLVSFPGLNWKQFQVLWPQKKINLPSLYKSIPPSLILCIVTALAVQNYSFIKFRHNGSPREFANLRQFYDWYQLSLYRDEKFLTFQWIHWSELFHLDPKVRAEPGYSMHIYDLQNKNIIRAYRDMRKLTKEKSVVAIRELRKFLGTDYVLVDKCVVIRHISFFQVILSCLQSCTKINTWHFFNSILRFSRRE